MGNLSIFLAIFAISLLPSIICNNPQPDTAAPGKFTDANNLKVQFDLRSQSSFVDITQINEKRRKLILNQTENPWNITLYESTVDLPKLLNYNITEVETNIEKFWPLYTYNKTQKIEINDRDWYQVDLDTVCDNLPYIKRSFNPENPEENSVDELAKNLTSTENKSDRFLIIMGHIGSGKTVTLIRMLQMLRNIAKEFWSLSVDLLKIPSNSNATEIFRQNLDEDSYKLFLQVLKNNPKKVNILLDNYDRIEDKNLRKKILEICIENNDKGVGIILTTSHTLDMEDFLQSSNIPKIFQIPKMTKNQMESYITNIWQDEIEAHNHYTQISNYAKVVAELLSTDEIIPQLFFIVKRLSKLLYNGHDLILDKNSFVNVLTYIKNKKSTNLPQLMKILLNVRINKMALFDQLMGLPSGPLETSLEATGEMALKEILASELPQVKDENYPSMGSDYTHYPTPKFIDTEIMRYLASKLFLKPEKTQLLMAELSLLLSNKKYVNVIEYFNGNLRNNNPELHIQTLANEFVKKNRINDLIDRLIENGFDDLVLSILKDRNKQQMAEYFLSNTNFNVESKSTYKFGLLVIDKNSSEALYCTRLEMVLKMKMEQTLSAILPMIAATQPDQLSKLLNQYLETIVLNDSKPSFKIYEIIRNHLGSLDPNSLNRLMLTTFRHAGGDSKEIVTDLIRQGADVRAIDQNGKNLILLAVQQSDPELLEYLVNDLNCSIFDASAESVLVQAFDANPFNELSRPQFWEMMHYLLSNQNFTIPNRIHSHSQKLNEDEFKQNKILWPFYELLAETDSKKTEKLVSKLMFADLSPVLSSDLSSMRRRSVLSEAYYNHENQPFTLTELLLTYRGVDTLGLLEDQFFFSTLNIAISQDSKSASEIQQYRISNKLCNTIHSTKDLQHLLSWLKFKTPVKVMTKEFKGNLVDNLLDCLNQPVQKSSISLSIEKNALLTRSEKLGRFLRHEDGDQQRLLLSIQVLSEKNPYYGSECMDKSAEEMPKGCAISRETFSLFVRNETRNGAVIGVIDTEKFSKLVNEGNNDDINSIRIDQLLGATAKLLFEKNYQLVGGRQSEILNKLRAGAVGMDSNFGLHSSRPWKNDFRGSTNLSPIHNGPNNPSDNFHGPPGLLPPHSVGAPVLPFSYYSTTSTTTPRPFPYVPYITPTPPRYPRPPTRYAAPEYSGGRPGILDNSNGVLNRPKYPVEFSPPKTPVFKPILPGI